MDLDGNSLRMNSLRKKIEFSEEDDEGDADFEKGGHSGYEKNKKG